MPETNPPIPPGTKLWRKTVLPEMTAWAESILDDSAAYPMFAEVRKDFSGEEVLARVEWHSWTFRNGVKVHGTFRGVTLYEVLPSADATPT